MPVLTGKRLNSYRPEKHYMRGPGPKTLFVTFGNVFGLALYDKKQKNVGKPEPRQLAAKPVAALEEGFDALPSISERALAKNGNGRTLAY